MSFQNADQVRQALAQKQRRTTTFTPYFSRVRFVTTRSSTPFVYTLAANLENTAFGYARGEDMAIAGLASTTATVADTNIISKGRTIGGQAVEISGISIQLLSNSNPEIACLAWPEISVKLSLNGGENAFILGTVGMLPGASGLYGMSSNDIGVQPIAGGRPFQGAMTNGLPGQHNQAAIPEGIVWMPEGMEDSTLNILLKTERAVVTLGVQKLDATAGSGILGYVFPTAAQTFLDIMVRLHGRVLGPRSNVA